MGSLKENLIAFGMFVAEFVKGMVLSTWYILVELVLFFIPKCLRAKDVSNETVLITGGASGLGRLMALKFAKLGAKVVVWDLNVAGLEETVKLVEEVRAKRESAGKCYYYAVDISDRHAVYAAAERVKSEIGPVTMLVNNAGVVTGKKLLDCTDEQIKRTFDVNTLAHFWVSTVYGLCNQIARSATLLAR